MMIIGLVFSCGSFLPSETTEKAQADSSDTSVTVTNASPVASAVSIDSGATNVTLTENTTKTVSCFATVTDNNGYSDITSVEAKLYKTSVGEGASDNDNNHYTLTGDTECVPSNPGTLTEDYTCDFDVYFFADPAEWTCQVTPSDSDGAGDLDTDTITVDSLNALNVDGTIAYGDMGLGTDTDTTPIGATVTNTGNTLMDPQVSASAVMTCATGTIPIGNQEYSATAAFDYGTGTDLTSSATTLDLTLPKPTVDTPAVEDESYWGILIPSDSVDGACTGAITFTAVAGS